MVKKNKKSKIDQNLNISYEEKESIDNKAKGKGIPGRETL